MLAPRPTHAALVLVLTLAACKAQKESPKPDTTTQTAETAAAPAPSDPGPTAPLGSTASKAAAPVKAGAVTSAVASADPKVATKMGVAGAGSSSKTAGDTADGANLTEFQKKRLLGHYSTMDGASGFILDRTQGAFKAKLDGANPIRSLAESNGPLGVKEYRAEGIWLRINENGSVLLFQGPKQHEGVRVIRDADANQLK